jgi:hypothetical protein
MKFFGTPSMLVKEKYRKPFTRELKFRPLFRFDANGEYETDDPVLVKKLSRKFKHEESGNDAQIPCFKCSHCGFEAKSPSGLSSHMKIKHKEATA